MYKAYNIPKIGFECHENRLITLGENQIIRRHKSVFEQKIASLKNPRTHRLNASLLTANWFPQIDADIFISHSHQDYENVVALAGWLYENFGITAFIDECLWGFCKDLLQLIDNEYCMTPDGKYYDYQKRNFSTSHVYMMLTMSLFEMIYKTECLFFYNTSQSIIPKDIFSSTEQTLSPWIFSELEMTKLIKPRKPEEHRSKPTLEESQHGFAEKSLDIEYEVDLSGLIEINDIFLNMWHSIKFADKFKALDYLYANT